MVELKELFETRNGGPNEIANNGFFLSEDRAGDSEKYIDLLREETMVKTTSL